MSDSYRLTIDVEAGDKRGLALLLELQRLGLSWHIERLPEKLTELELRPYRRAGGKPLGYSEVAVDGGELPPADPERAEQVRAAVRTCLDPSHYEPRSHE